MVRLGISRRTLQEVIDELKADSSIWLTADEPAEHRRRALIQALAKARLLKDTSPWRQPELVAPYWSADAGPPPAKSELEGLMGKAKAQVPFLRDGVDVGPWTGDFWHGLRLSEVLRLHGGYPRVQPGRPWLEADLEHLPFPGRLSPPDPQGRRWLVKCQAHRLPAGKRFDVAVMAGMLAGATREEHLGTWLVLPNSPEVVQQLEWWRIPYQPASQPNKIRASIFYGALFSRHMPPATARSMWVRRAALCPLLPLAILEAYSGPGPAPTYLIPERAGAIPYACGDATRKRRHWHRDFLFHAAVALGVHFVPLQQRELLQQWREESALQAAVEEARQDAAKE